MREKLILALLVGATLTTNAAQAQTLRGSRASMLEQNGVARQHDFTFLQTSAQVRQFVGAGYLVPLQGNQDYTLNGLSHPYVRPEVRLFVERLASQYRATCGEQLVITSATRPRNQQPRNASPLSVHPAGMAVDLRIPQGRCRTWLENLLLSLDRIGVLNATRESRPPHYHVAVYPRQYAAYAQRITGRPVRLAGRSSVGRSQPTLAVRATPIPATATAPASVTHRIERGESLWLVAQRYGTSIEALQRLNGLPGVTVRPGQQLRIPVMVHRVATGEVLSRIAEQYGVSVAELQRANELTSPGVIREGDRLFIPGGVAEHRVVAGDTLSDIASAYGSSISRIRQVNNLTSDVIRPGQRLLIPVGRP